MSSYWPEASEANMTPTNIRHVWDDAWRDVGNEEWLTAKALLEVDTHRVLVSDASRFIRPNGNGQREADGTWHAEVTVDWDAWVADVDERGRGWSSTERRLFELAASLVIPERPVRLVGVLDRMDSWEADVWRILVEWGTGGNNREHLGRATAVRR